MHKIDIHLDGFAPEEVNIVTDATQDGTRLRIELPTAVRGARTDLFAFRPNSAMTFDNFISGASNQFAVGAARAICRNPAGTYNPLFIYGGSGLGKSHLTHAVGNALLQADFRLRVCCLTAEQFCSALVDVSGGANRETIREKFRPVDALLVDDVQTLAGNETAQEAFIHAIDAFYEAHKQIVLTADTSPREIPELDDRLLMRFKWGLITDLLPPGMKMKAIYLRTKAAERGLKLPPEIVARLAKDLPPSFRAMEGAVVRLQDCVSQTGAAPDLDLVAKICSEV